LIAAANQRMKLTGAAILVSRAMKVLQAAPAAYPYRSATEKANLYYRSTIQIMLSGFDLPTVPTP